MGKVVVEYGEGIRLTSSCEGFPDKVITDAPKVIGGMEEHISPTDLLGMALGACVLTMMGMAAKRVKVDLSGARVHVNKTFAGMKIASINVDVYYDASLEEAQVAALKSAANSCPVYQAIGSDVEHTVTFHFGASSAV